MKGVIRFLKLNGFKHIEKNSYATDSGCNVVIEKDGYAVADSEGGTMYSKDHNIYWLIGVLTYYGYINKNYNQP